MRTLLTLVLAMCLAFVFSAPCHAKPVQLLDYDAQTFFENYKLTCKRNAPVLDDAFPDSKLVYQRDTGLYKEYAFRTRNNVFIHVYENKANAISSVEVRKDIVPNGWSGERFATPTTAVEATLGLSKGERDLLFGTRKKSHFKEKGIWGATYQCGLFIERNFRYIHLKIRVITSTEACDSISFFYSADDEE